MQADLTVYLAGLAKYAEEKQNNKVLLGDLGALARGRFEKVYLAEPAEPAEPAKEEQGSY